MTVMIELPLLEGLSTHHVFYDFPSLHVSSPLLFCRLLALCQYQSDRVHILYWHSTAITYYTNGVIKGGWRLRLLGWCGCREVKMEYGFFFLASVLEYLTVYLFLYFFSGFFFSPIASPEPVWSRYSLQQRTRGKRMAFPVILLLWIYVFLLASKV